MTKSSLERQLQKQAKEKALQQQASSIVNVQEVIEGFRIIDDTAESVLKVLLAHCTDKDKGNVSFENSFFPPIIQRSLGLELEKLQQYGMLHVTMR